MNVPKQWNEIQKEHRNPFIGNEKVDGPKSEIQPEPRAHSHFFKDVSKLQTVDVYRVLELFSVTDPCLQHAAKKILCAGGRGSKDIKKDIQEAIDSLNRRLEMYREDGQ